MDLQPGRTLPRPLGGEGSTARLITRLVCCCAERMGPPWIRGLGRRREARSHRIGQAAMQLHRAGTAAT
jgi:hypothetical protein